MVFFRAFSAYLVMLFTIYSFCIGCSGGDVLAPAGNITITWDVVNWTSDGYVALVTIHNFQQYQPIRAPGWTFGWTWANEEMIWSVVGGQTTEQGNCSKFVGKIPICCQQNPKIVDLTPKAQPDRQIASCCKGGVLSSWGQDPANSISMFQLLVGAARVAKRRTTLPINFTFEAPNLEFSCEPAVVVKPSKFVSKDGKVSRHAKITWSITCAQITLAKPSCCVSFSSFVSDTLWRCPRCSCGCQDSSSCINSMSPNLGNVVPLGVRCTNHMCPVRVHWHLKLNSWEYWEVKVTIINFDERFSFPWWNLIVQHPSFDNATIVTGLNYKLLNSETIQAAMIWGVQFHNELLIQGTHIESNIQFQKLNMSLSQSWAPQSIFFDGGRCMMSPLSSSFFWPNASPGQQISMHMFSFLSLAVTAYMSMARKGL